MALQPAGQTHQFPRESRQGLRPSLSPSYWSKPPSRTGHWARGWRSGAASNRGIRILVLLLYSFENLDHLLTCGGSVFLSADCT